MSRLTQLIEKLNQAAARLAFGLMILVVAVGAFNALARYLGRSLGRDLSSNAYLELQWYLFAAIFLLAGPFALQRDAHVRVDVLYDRLSQRVQAWIDLVGHLLLLLPFAVFVVIVSWAPVRESFRVREVSPDPGGLPRYPIKAVLPLAFAMLALQGLAQVLKTWRRLGELKREREQGGAGEAPQETPPDDGAAETADEEQG